MHSPQRGAPHSGELRATLDPPFSFIIIKYQPQILLSNLFDHWIQIRHPLSSSFYLLGLDIWAGHVIPWHHSDAGRAESSTCVYSTTTKKASRGKKYHTREFLKSKNLAWNKITSVNTRLNAKSASIPWPILLIFNGTDFRCFLA